MPLLGKSIGTRGVGITKLRNVIITAQDQADLHLLMIIWAAACWLAMRKFRQTLGCVMFVFAKSQRAT